MAQVLTKVVAYGVEASEAVTKRFRQFLILTGTGAGTDLTYDIGVYAGTFWTAVGATATGAEALKAIKDIQVRAEALIDVGGKGIIGLGIVGVAPATGQVRLEPNGTNAALPDLTFFTAEGPTAWQFVLEWVLRDAEMPVELGRSA